MKKPAIYATLLTSTYSNRKILVLFLILIVVQAIDATIGNLSDIFRDFAVSFWGVALFVGFAIIYCFGQYLILNLVKAKNKEQEIKRSHFKMLEKVVTAIQYVLIAITVFLVLEIIFTLQYHTILLNIAIIISAGSAVYILGLLAYWFLSWFIRARALIVLLYGLAMTASAITTVGLLVSFNTFLIDKDETITPQSEVIFPDPSNWANIFQTVSSVISFILVWAATVVLLRHNIHRIGRIKFWALSSIPLIVFATIYLSVYQSYPSFVTEDPINSIVIPVLFIIYTGIAAAILIGLAFSSVARKVSEKISIRDYLYIVSYGFILFYITQLTNIAGGGYPPFGIINVLLIGPLSFLILTGLYRSAISVAEDAKLRSSIRDTTKKELDLLYDIGTAETSKEIEKKVMTIMKKNRDAMFQESGVTPSLTDKEIEDLVSVIRKERRNIVEHGKERKKP